MRGVFNDLTGKTFGRLTVTSRHEDQSRHGAFWNCLCACGKQTKKPIGTHSLIQGKTQSCGCLMVERVKEANSTHQQTLTPTYIVWRQMWARTTNKRHKSYERYKGFTPVDRWKSFENFLADMGARPDGTSLDRINNNAGYSPENCRWANAFEQQGNTKRNIYVQINGETLCLKAACRVVGVPYSRAKSRVQLGWSPEAAITTPPRITSLTKGQRLPSGVFVKA